MGFTGFTVDEKSPEAQYVWTWKATPLGAMLREKGSVYTQLTPAEKKDLTQWMTHPSYGPALQLPIPEEHTPPLVERASAKFTMLTDGWHIAKPE